MTARVARAGQDVAAFDPPADPGDGLRAAAVCRARSRPMERASLVIRSQRRLTALRTGGADDARRSL